MGHHDHSSPPINRSKSIKALRKTLALVVIFMLVELIFGWVAHSLALITDALHLFTDAAAILLSLFAFWMAKRPATKRMSFGYHRIEIIVALISGGATWALSGFLIYEGIKRLFEPHTVNGPLVLIVASIGLLANLLMMKILHPRQSESLNMKGAYVHILGDLLASIGVVISGLLITLTHFDPIDPIVTFFIAILVIRSAWKLIKETLQVLMEGTPPGINLEKIEEDLIALPSIQDVHDLHVWAITQSQINLSVHLKSDQPTKALEQAESLLHKEYQIKHTTIQVEPLEGFNCESCDFNA